MENGEKKKRKKRKGLGKKGNGREKRLGCYHVDRLKSCT
jgi:hypothetical protein